MVWAAAVTSATVTKSGPGRCKAYRQKGPGFAFMTRDKLRCKPAVRSIVTGDTAWIDSLDAPDQLMPTYESWVCRRESWLPPFPLTRRYERDRESTGRFEE
jgi:hypothetical protein